MPVRSRRPPGQSDVAQPSPMSELSLHEEGADEGRRKPHEHGSEQRLPHEVEREHVHQCSPVTWSSSWWCPMWTWG